MKKVNLIKLLYSIRLFLIPAVILQSSLFSFCPAESSDRNQKPLRPVSTYSIVALDKETGQLGVAVQSHWFSVGSIVSWAEAGVGAVATQSFVDPGYGALGLEMMRAGKSAEQALSGLLKSDPTPEVRQVAMVDAAGRVAVHTGKNCIAEAGHYQADGFSCQANMMLKNTVWQAMARAYQNTRGELVDRLLAALEAAEREGGDIRGRQSAAILVVRGQSSGVWWKDRLYDLRIEDHPEPISEMKRLVQIAKAYNHMNRGDELLTENRVKEAMKEYSRAMELYSGNPELIFWPAVTMASTGRVEDSLPLFRKVFSLDPKWALLLQRLPAVGQFPKDRKLMKRILAEIPKK